MTLTPSRVRERDDRLAASPRRGPPAGSPWRRWSAPARPGSLRGRVALGVGDRAVTPAFLNAWPRYLRSNCSQRTDDCVSGSSTATLPLPPLPPVVAAPPVLDSTELTCSTSHSRRQRGRAAASSQRREHARSPFSFHSRLPPPVCVSAPWLLPLVRPRFAAWFRAHLPTAARTRPENTLLRLADDERERAQQLGALAERPRTTLSLLRGGRDRVAAHRLAHRSRAAARRRPPAVPPPRPCSG